MTNMQARYEALLDKFKDLGRQEGQGKDALTECYLTMIDAASEGVADLGKDKHGKGIDDASYLYAAYSAENRKNTRYSAGKEDTNIKVQISKLRKIAEFGSMTKFGSAGHPVDLVNSMVKMIMLVREKSPRAIKELDAQYGVTGSGRKLRGIQEAILLLARAQLKADHVLSTQEIFELACKPVPHSKTLEDYLVAQHDKVQALREGKAEGSTLQYDSPAMMAVASALHNALEEIRALATAKPVEEVEEDEDGDAQVEAPTPVPTTEAERSAEERKAVMAQLAADDNGMPVAPARYGSRVSNEYKERVAAMAAAAVPDGSEEA